MNNFEFNKDNIKKVNIGSIHINSWNPKHPNAKEYDNVKRSIEVNGFAQPILVRRDGEQYEIIDGQHRYLAAKELGYNEIYIYDAGEISDEEAKSMTLWMQVQVPFDEIILAPIVVELSENDIELPFTEKEIADFKDINTFSFDDSNDESSDMNSPEEGFKTLKIRLTESQFEVVHNSINLVSKNENVSEGRALELLVADGLSGYEQTNYPLNN